MKFNIGDRVKVIDEFSNSEFYSNNAEGKIVFREEGTMNYLIKFDKGKYNIEGWTCGNDSEWWCEEHQIKKIKIYIN